MSATIYVLLSILLWNVVASAESECGPCAPGSYFVECDGLEPLCKPCNEGLTYTDKDNKYKICQECTPECRDPNAYVTQNCTKIADLKCTCAEGFYGSATYELCYPHSTCPPKKGVVKQGTSETNTLCGGCPDGTFSSEHSLKTCEAHTNCSALGMKLVKEGGQDRDNECEIECVECKECNPESLQIVLVVAVVLGVFLAVACIIIICVCKKNKQLKKLKCQRCAANIQENQDWHKENIKQCRSIITEKLLVDECVLNLRAKFLTEDQAKRIRAKGTRSEMAEALLDLLEKSPAQCYYHFINYLEEHTAQKYIAEHIKKTKGYVSQGNPSGNFTVRYEKDPETSEEQSTLLETVTDDSAKI